MGGNGTFLCVQLVQCIVSFHPFYPHAYYYTLPVVNSITANQRISDYRVHSLLDHSRIASMSHLFVLAQRSLPRSSIPHPLRYWYTCTLHLSAIPVTWPSLCLSTVHPLTLLGKVHRACSHKRQRLRGTATSDSQRAATAESRPRPQFRSFIMYLAVLHSRRLH